MEVRIHQSKSGELRSFLELVNEKKRHKYAKIYALW